MDNIINTVVTVVVPRGGQYGHGYHGGGYAPDMPYPHTTAVVGGQELFSNEPGVG
jgi:hypothetical protein